MELIALLVGFAGLGLAALTAGADSRPRLDEGPRRSI